MIFCINDLDEKSYRIGSFSSELQDLFSPWKYTFTYFFFSKNEMIEFSNLEQDVNFKLYRKNNKLPLFDINQKVTYPDIDDKIAKMLKNGKIKIDDSLLNKKPLVILLDEELYIKILPFNKFIGISEIKAEHEIIRKF